MNTQTHTVVKNGETYKYPCIVSATHVNGKYKSIRRTFGNKRTEAQAREIVSQWETKMGMKR